MHTELKNLGRKNRLGSWALALAFLLVGVYILTFFYTPFLKGGPVLTEKDYRKATANYRINMKNLSEQLGTAAEGRYHYFLVDDGQRLSLYETSQKESERLQALPKGTPLGATNVKTMAMSSGMLESVKQVLLPGELEKLNTSTIFSNYEFEKDKVGVSVAGGVFLLAAVGTVLSIQKTRKRTEKQLAAFLAAYPMVTHLDFLQEQADYRDDKLGMAIKGDYLLSWKRGFLIENLRETQWMYMLVRRYYFLFKQRMMTFVSLDGTRYMPLDAGVRTKDEHVNALFEAVAERFPHILLGMTAENRAAVAALKRERKQEQQADIGKY